MCRHILIKLCLFKKSTKTINASSRVENHGTSWRRCNSDEFWRAVVLLHTGNMNWAVPGKKKTDKKIVLLFIENTPKYCTVIILSNQTAHVNKWGAYLFMVSTVSMLWFTSFGCRSLKITCTITHIEMRGSF